MLRLLLMCTAPSSRTFVASETRCSSFDAAGYVYSIVQEIVDAVGKVASAASTKRLRPDSAGMGAVTRPALIQPCVLALMLLDSAYNWLLYECSHAQKPGVPGASAIPPPHEYFTLFAGPWDPTLDCTTLPPLVARFLGDVPAVPQQGAQPACNPLLQLFMARWQETELYFGAIHVCPEDLAPSGLGSSAPIQGDEPQTLKNGDPVCWELQARWRESVRTFACRMYAFAVPTTKAIAVLKRHCPMVEVGAGTGYWASLVREAGGDITALDCQPTDSGVHTSAQEILGDPHGSFNCRTVRDCVAGFARPADTVAQGHMYVAPEMDFRLSQTPVCRSQRVPWTMQAMG